MFAWALAYWPPLDALANKLLLVLVGVALSLCLHVVYRRLCARRWSYIALGLAAVACSFAAAPLWMQAQALLFQTYFALAHEATLELRPVELSFGTLLYYGFVLLTWSVLYFGVKIWDEAQFERTRAERAEAAAQAERLRALQGQLNPHFLFNALNVVSTLVDEGDNAAAKYMIARLSRFLRLALDAIETPQITVGEEIEFVRCWLDIEHARFGDRLRTSIDVTPDALPALLPTLLLQPLVENAVKHGVLSRESGGAIAVRVASDGERLRITISDDGRAAPGLHESRRGIGLSNTAARLAELYGAAAEVAFAATDAGGVTTVTLPLCTQSSSQALP
jgi:LytS/YehU family sensor histidine kinase